MRNKKGINSYEKKQKLVKFLMAAMFASSMANAQNAEVKTISAQDLPKANAWSTVVEKGWKAQVATANFWKKKKNVNVLQVIVSDSNEWVESSNKDRVTLNYGLVYKDDKGNVYYASGLSAEKAAYPYNAWTDTVLSVSGDLVPQYQVEGYPSAQTVDLTTLKTISKVDLPKNNNKWATANIMDEGGYAVETIKSAWKENGVEALAVITSADRWENIRDAEGNEGGLKGLKYDLVYRDNGVVYYAKDLIARGLSGYARFLYSDVDYTLPVPDAIVPDFILTAAQLDTMKTMSMCHLPGSDSISINIADGASNIYKRVYAYARYNINDDVVQIYPKSMEWVSDKGTDVMNFDMIHKTADGKVFFTYGYTVTRTDAENFAKAKAWKKKMHEVEVADWNEETWKESVKTHEVVTISAKRQYKTKSELPKEGMKDAATIKQLTKLAKENYPGLKKIIVRNTTPEVSKNFLGKIIKRVILFDVIYEKKTNASKKIYVKENLIVEQKHDGKSYEKNWSNRGYTVWNDTYTRGMFDDSEYNITDWK